MGKLSSRSEREGTSKRAAQALLDPPAAGDDVLDHQDALVGRQREPAAQLQLVVHLLGEDVAGLGLAGDLLADHESAHRRGEDGRVLPAGGLDLGQQELREALHGRHVLADLGALEVMAAVEAGAEHEVPGEEGAGAGEDVEDFLLLGVHAGASPAGKRAEFNAVRALRR